MRKEASFFPRLHSFYRRGDRMKDIMKQIVVIAFSDR